MDSRLSDSRLDVLVFLVGVGGGLLLFNLIILVLILYEVRTFRTNISRRKGKL